MAKQQLFQIKDRLSGLLGPVIMLERREGPAIRAFHDALGNKNSQTGQHPEDYILLKVGEQDDETGDITPSGPEVVADGAGWVEVQKMRQLHANHEVSPTGPQLAGNGPRSD